MAKKTSSSSNNGNGNGTMALWPRASTRLALDKASATEGWFRTGSWGIMVRVHRRHEHALPGDGR